MTLVLRLSNSGLSLAMYPSSVVQTGVKSLGCEKRIAHLSPIHSWNRIVPSVVSAVKSGASSPMRTGMLTSVALKVPAAPAPVSDSPVDRIVGWMPLVDTMGDINYIPARGGGPVITSEQGCIAADGPRHVCLHPERPSRRQRSSDEPNSIHQPRCRPTPWWGRRIVRSRRRAPREGLGRLYRTCEPGFPVSIRSTGCAGARRELEA